ncbi:cilia- and flagella-associated protein HOATZ [Harpia harpyja]|uniref:cilia- and flagella-associated protein HOATZ n=1 Tax=Harpia harpyja TaxID=202280 RepID=UPI0022B10DBD|nr:cilia- and flagella-associated protein HOATZ [Harpia harpyja]
MERGHHDAAPCSATGTGTEQHLMAPDGPLVFAGSSPANVGFACTFWTSAVLPPPFESCLGPATLQQRSTALQGPQLPRKSEKNSEKETLSKAQSVEKTKVKEKHLQQARRREEVLALQRKQREERIAKELMSHSHKPKVKTDQVSRRKVSEADLMDQEAVKALK